MSTESKAVVRHLARPGTKTFPPCDLTWGYFITFCTVEAVIVLWTLFNARDVSMLLAGLLATGINCGIFLCPVPGPKDARKVRERVIHVAPRMARAVGRWVEGKVDVHIRELEGLHYTHRTLPTDIPFSIHLGEQLWLSSFDWRGRPVGLIVQGGTRLRPWRATHAVVLRVAGEDSMLLESETYQEHLLGLWTSCQDTMFKQNLGLTGLQVLMSSRPFLPNEAAHWVDRPDDQSKRAVRYRAVEAVHDEVATERCMWLVFRSGGTVGSWFTARHRGSSRAGVEASMRSALDNAWSAIPKAKLKIVNVLDASDIANRMRIMTNPSTAPAVGYHLAGKAPASRPTHIAPISHWDDTNATRLECNGWVYQTFRVTGWPARHIGPQFIYAQIMNHQGGLLVSETITPEDPKTSLYTAKAGITNAVGKAQRRAAKGTVTTATDELLDSQASWIDEELAAGHRGTQHDMYLTTYNRTVEEMERAGDDLAIQCGAIGVQIDPCHSFQGEAFRYVLPICWRS